MKGRVFPMHNYKTISGDTWDLIAFKQLGSCNYTEVLINANRNHIDKFIFPAGVELLIPDIENEQKKLSLPPWRA